MTKPVLRNDSIILYPLPQGKPNPKTPFVRGKEDERPVVPEDPTKDREIKGGSYGLNYIRDRIGKNVAPQNRAARENEKAFSQLRKDLSMCKFQNVVALSFMAKSAGSLSLTDLRRHLPSLNKTYQELSPILGERSKTLFELVQRYCSQSEHTPFDRLVEDNCPRCADIFLKFLKTRDFDPTTQTDAETWKNLSHSEKNTRLTSYADALAFNAYGLKAATWDPHHQPVTSLIKTLEDHGKVHVIGKFGQDFFNSPPTTFDAPEGCPYPLYGWKSSSAIPGISRVRPVIILGAQEGGPKGGYVYYFDPAEVKNRKVYLSSYEAFAQRMQPVLFFQKGDNRLEARHPWGVHQ